MLPKQILCVKHSLWVYLAKVTVVGTGVGARDGVGAGAGVGDYKKSYFYKLHEVAFGFKRLWKIFFLEFLISYVCQTKIIF